MEQNKKGIRSYLKNYKGPIFFYTLVYILASACSIFITIFSAEMVTLITDKLYDKAILTGAVVCGLIAAQILFYWASGFIYQKYSLKIMMELNYDLARQAFKLNSKTYADHNTGTFVQRITNDPQNVVSGLANIFAIITSLATSIITFVYIATLNLWLGLILFAIMIIGTVYENFKVKYRRKRQKVVKAKWDKVNSITNEIVRSEKDIKAMGLEEKLGEISKENYEDYRKYSCKTNLNETALGYIRNLFLNLSIIAVLIIGIVFLKKEFVGLATFMIIYSNRGSIYSIIMNFGRIGNTIVDIQISQERMFALFDEDEFVTEKFGNVMLEVNGGGMLEFKNVDYTYVEYEYPDAASKVKVKKRNKKIKQERKVISENHIFKNLSFKINSNTTVAFVGKSGSGKSTILNLMSKLYEVDDGQVLINGVNINDLTKESLRNTISLVNQFPYIFDMSIKDNLLLAKKEATEEDIKKAIVDACLDEFIATLPNGIETKVGESGIKLSGGQKQRLAIARALLKNSSVIIFDESTSSLDNFAQGHIKQSIDNLKGKTTVVIVAHRLSTIKDVDKIFFLEEGKIVDEGTFDELFERNEMFKTMFLAENI